MNVYVNHNPIRLNPRQAIGKGGEADVFDIGSGTALKLFKGPDHSDYQGSPAQQQAAAQRLAEHQQKLRQFPQGLPSQVVQPIDLVSDRQGQTLLGYTMPLVRGAEPLRRYGDRAFRQSSGSSAGQVVELLVQLHATVSKLHQCGVVIGDFNDLNVLVRGGSAHIIDADSFQFGPFLCRVFTARFVDPLLCQPGQTQPLLAQPYTAKSDWYAFAVMVMQSLLYVDPYGGVYKPAQPSGKIPHAARPLHRITVFHPEVKYPKPAMPYTILPDDLLHYFHQVFEQDRRGLFPLALLQTLRWTTCTTCGLEHGRVCCPVCTHLLPVAVHPAQAMRGNLKVQRLFSTGGTILDAAYQMGRLGWVYHEHSAFWREDKSLLFHGDLSPDLRLWLQGRTTLVGQPGQVVALSPGQPPTYLGVESGPHLALMPGLAVSATHRYWLQGGQLWRDDASGLAPSARYLGDVLAGQTCFWVGEQFGAGFYRAGQISVAFVFDAQRPGINDRVDLPWDSGQILDAHCTFGGDRAWLFWASQNQGQTLHHCAVIRPDGQVEATAAADPQTCPWLANLRGGAVSHQMLLTATDEGMVRVEVQQGQLTVTQTFPDTEPFVDSSSRLVASSQGVYVIGQQHIDLLQLEP